MMVVVVVKVVLVSPKGMVPNDEVINLPKTIISTIDSISLR